jgi:hypothetical protein
MYAAPRNSGNRAKPDSSALFRSQPPKAGGETIPSPQRERTALRLIAAHKRCTARLKTLGLQTSNVAHWYQAYFFSSLSGPSLLDLMVVAARLSYQPLFLDTANETTRRLAGKTPDEIRTFFCLPAQMEPELESLLHDRVFTISLK